MKSTDGRLSGVILDYPSIQSNYRICRVNVDEDNTDTVIAATIGVFINLPLREVVFIETNWVFLWATPW